MHQMYHQMQQMHQMHQMQGGLAAGMGGAGMGADPAAAEAARKCACGNFKSGQPDGLCNACRATLP